MSDQIQCPKCKSSQISAQKRGFSAGKAVAGAVVTGGVGLLAGFHGSSNIDVFCLACGHKWNPAKLAQEKKTAQQQKALREEKAWKNQFYSLYEANHKEAADFIRPYRGTMLKDLGVDGLYKSLKNDDQTINIITGVVIALFLGLIFWVISCIT